MTFPNFFFCVVGSENHLLGNRGSELGGWECHGQSYNEARAPEVQSQPFPRLPGGSDPAAHPCHWAGFTKGPSWGFLFWRLRLILPSVEVLKMSAGYFHVQSAFMWAQHVCIRVGGWHGGEMESSSTSSKNPCPKLSPKKNTSHHHSFPA